MSHEIWLEDPSLPTPSHQLVDHLVRHHGFRSPDACRRHFERILGDLRLYDRNVLEILQGPGWISLHAASQGAKEVFAVAATELGTARLGRLRSEAERLGLSRFRVVPKPYATAELPEAHFDLVVVRSSLTFLDAEACWTLEDDPASRQRYLDLFARLHLQCRPGAHLVITDVSRRNVWPALGLSNPFSPETEWERHPPPEVWIELLREAGFTRPQLEWRQPIPSASVAKVIPTSWIAPLLGSRYRLVLRRDTAES